MPFMSITAHVKYRVMLIVCYSELLLLLMGSAHGMLKCGGVFSSGLARFVPAFSCVQWEGGSLPPRPQSAVSNGAEIPGEASLAA